MIYFRLTILCIVKTPYISNFADHKKFFALKKIITLKYFPSYKKIEIATSNNCKLLSKLHSGHFQTLQKSHS